MEWKAISVVVHSFAQSIASIDYSMLHVRLDILLRELLRMVACVTRQHKYGFRSASC